MKINDHLEKTTEFAVYPDAQTGTIQEFMYLALGLANEAGEAAGEIKKMYRDGTVDIDAVQKEFGDVYWYLHQLHRAFMLDPEETLYMNWHKLYGRSKRGVLRGRGDNR